MNKLSSLDIGTLPPKLSTAQPVSCIGQGLPFNNSREGDKPSLGIPAPSQDLPIQANANQKSGDPRVRDVVSFTKAPTSIVLGNSPVDQRRTRYVFLLDDNRAALTAKESPGGRSGNLDLMIKHDDRLMEKMEESNHRASEDQEDFSDGGSEGSLDDVRQHPGIIKGAKSDDHEYLTLYEAHLSRLEEVGNTSSGLTRERVCTELATALQFL